MTDVTVAFEVTDPVERTDIGTVTFGVWTDLSVEQPKQAQEANIVLDTKVSRAGTQNTAGEWVLATNC